MRTDLAVTRLFWRRRSLPSVLVAVFVAVGTLLPGVVAGGLRATAHAAGPCDPGGNPVVCENSKPGAPQSEWDVSSGGDTTIEGFATDMSVNVGDTVRFKVKAAADYTIDIYRIGYYGGDGARKVATVARTGSLAQPSCLTDETTGLIDCGNWSVSASWSVPADAVSGVYVANLVRKDTGGNNHVPFVVRNDASSSDLVFQTSDTTWQAYNDYGGNSLYVGSPAGRAYKVSYNRPFHTRMTTPDGRDFFFSTEYPMVRWLEANGYDVTYTTGIDSDRRGALLKNHKVFLSVGHDEYWSGAQRANVEAARDAGVSLAFFSGNEVFWKTRWEPSIDGTGTPYRTLVTYKETKDDAKIDPSATWTGTWRDPRFSPPADGGRPENALTGTAYTVNCCSYAIQVPAEDGAMRFWRNTDIAALRPGQVATLPDETLGYEWDEDLDNGFRPAGLIHLSTTTQAVEQHLLDYGNTVGAGSATHHLTLYRVASGALVFGAGTVQWSWGLDDQHEGTINPVDSRMRQATVNLFADMGVQPLTLQPGLIRAAASTDTTAPTSTITSPAAGAAFTTGQRVTITGTATDSGGGRVGGVEVSTDGGNTWHAAQGRENWSYTWSVTGFGPVSLRTRAADDSGNIEAPAAGRSVTVACPCRLFGETETPGTASAADTQPIEVGVKFRSSIDGWISGVRFYKGSSNTGTHTGSLWTATGTRLATATFTGESATGWQQVDFASPIAVQAGTTYVTSYFAPNGGYAADSRFFAQPLVRDPLTALQDGTDGGNGVYRYGSAGFPAQTYNAANYWVDPVFTTVAPPDSTPPTVTAVTPPVNSSSIPTTVRPTATFSEAMQASTVTVSVRDSAGGTVTGTTAYDAASRTATFTPGAALAAGTTFTVAVSGAKDAAGNVMAAPYTWTFRTAAAAPPAGTCPCSLWDETATPATVQADDARAVELGVKFRADRDGEIRGIRFYKSAGNTGPHAGTLWDAAGNQLATATFAAESSSGWQQVDFATPVAIRADTAYVASYHTDSGNYSLSAGQLSAGPVVNGPLTAVQNNTTDGPNGVFGYGPHAFPTAGNGHNYWVDVVFAPTKDTTPPVVVATNPEVGETGVGAEAPVQATFSESVQPDTITFTLTGPDGAAVPATVRYDAVPRTAVLTASAPFALGKTYTATVSGATDTAGNPMAAPVRWSFTTAGTDGCPCTIWPASARPATDSMADGKSVEVGVKFRAASDGYVTGVRFYKGTANTGRHVGNLWATDGTLLARATFDSETASGWQQVSFASAVPVQAGRTYVASYFAPFGRYAANAGFFTAGSVSRGLLTALGDGVVGANGVYTYAASSAYPASSYGSANYWVDVVFTTEAPPDTVAPTVASTAPVANAGTVPTTTTVSATFDEPVQPDSVRLALTSAGGATAGSLAYDASTRSATFTPDAPLAAATTYTATVDGAVDAAGNAMAAPARWTFTTAAAPRPAGVCPCSLWDDTAVPDVASAGDSTPVELGVRFVADTDGLVTGIRFYKGIDNTGTHTGTLWDAQGRALATVAFTGESATGWQTALFATPVAVTAGAVYTASYSAPNGGYAYSRDYFDRAWDNPPLRASAHTDAAPNGVYALEPSTFPIVGRGTNYWVDVVFERRAGA